MALSSKAVASIAPMRVMPARPAFQRQRPARTPRRPTHPKPTRRKVRIRPRRRMPLRPVPARRPAVRQHLLLARRRVRRTVRIVLQRVTEARVTVAGETVGAIGGGLVLLVGVGPEDTEASAAALAEK